MHVVHQAVETAKARTRNAKKSLSGELVLLLPPSGTCLISKGAKAICEFGAIGRHGIFLAVDDKDGMEWLLLASSSQQPAKDHEWQ